MAIIVPNGFPIIEERMETLIMDTLNSEDQFVPLITMNGIEVSVEDLQCLTGPTWLNDKVSNINY